MDTISNILMNPAAGMGASGGAFVLTLIETLNPWFKLITMFCLLIIAVSSAIYWTQKALGKRSD